ncbi:MAG: MBL fold metallo-hydrolase [Proteobacteria bacterium]|nr:MBL fold metallo-hydrolase [Pseudomonadota bacterium]MBU1639889.1 MBL fold metallo-hydrolase [Pseudomonadota bacterium]
MIDKLVTTLCIICAGTLALVTPLQADDVKIIPTKITKQIFMLAGEGGNIGLFIGKDGTFLIDDQYAPLTEKILAAIQSVGGDTPKFLINTHYHGDHTGGNEKLGKSGALIFSHDNVRERLSTGSFLEAFNNKREPLTKEGLPVVTFSEDISFHLNGDTVHAMHVPHAHTDGDSFIAFKTANVIHAGDFFFNGFYPFIDVHHGGSLKGMITAVDKVLALADDQTKIIPGHGPLADKAQLISYRQMLSTAYERLSKLKASGKTAQEAAAAKPLADLDPTWGHGLFTGERWIELIYPGV